LVTPTRREPRESATENTPPTWVHWPQPVPRRNDVKARAPQARG
jgi:hypothetical protein